MDIDAPDPTWCIYCGHQSEVPLQRCGVCKLQYYCSPECQRGDWKSGHKDLCKLQSLAWAVQTTTAQHTGEPIKGVYLTCTKEPGGFYEVNIPSDHIIFRSQMLEVPAMLGIPLVMARVGTKSDYQPDLDCQIAIYLNIKYSDGLAPPHWQSHVGSCTVARRDKKPLSSQHLEAVWMYMDRLLDCYGEVSPKKAQKLVNRADFEKWFAMYKKNQVTNGRKEWENVGSLYHL
jgi:hypothetical protein